MKQTILTEKGSKKITKLEELYLLRNNYYKELMRELQILQNRRNEKIKSYKITVYEIDKQINKLNKGGKHGKENK
jgi:hypothetical protein